MRAVPDGESRMGCFCRKAVLALQDAPPQASTDGVPLELEPLIPAVSAWLAARWLPAPSWEPDPAWLEIEIPEPAMRPEALAIVLGLVQAQRACIDTLSLDPSEPDQVARLARIIGTLNRRMDDFEAFEDEPVPWAALAIFNDHLDTVQAALARNILEPAEEAEPPLAPWRPLLAKVKAIAPLLAIAQILELDLGDEQAMDTLAVTMRKLTVVKLPPLENPLLTMRIIARFNAIARLKQSIGADPSRVPFERVKAVVERKAKAMTALLPERIALVGDHLTGMPPLQPNPAALVTPAVMDLIKKIPPGIVEAVRWQPPKAEQFDILTTVAPVAALAGLLAKLGVNPVRASPCGRACDAGPATMAGGR